MGDSTLLDAALARLGAVVGDVAVNAHHHAEQVVAHVAGRAFVSVEPDEALGTAGGVAHLRPWLDGRAVVVVNGDTWTSIPLGPLVEGWDGSVVRVLVRGADTLGPGAEIVGCLLPPAEVATLPDGPAGLYEVCWRPALEAGRLEVVRGDGSFVACDCLPDYLAANLQWSGGEPVVGAGAVVAGTLVRSVVWPGGEVGPLEVLVDAIRTDDGRTVLVR